MNKYEIEYTGSTSIVVYAKNPEEAENIFWTDGLNILSDAIIESITEVVG